MRLHLLVLFLCNTHVFTVASLDFWKKLLWKPSHRQSVQKNKADTGVNYDNNYSGRIFVTMLGYPARCDINGVSHPCTLSIACWLVGGVGYEGCGVTPWLVACCVTVRSSSQVGNHQYRLPATTQLYKDQEIDDGLSYQLLENREVNDGPPIMQKRIDSGGELMFRSGGEETCGRSSRRILSKRIIGGNEAHFGQYPWQAYIKIGSYQCGGVLVSRRFVATAAHCIIAARLKDILVYLGELDTQDTGKVMELAPAELHRVKRRLIHPQFEFRSTQPDRYDLALLEMLTEARNLYHIAPVCLPAGDDENFRLEGRMAVVAGWGKVLPSNELMGTNVLRSASVPIIDINECKRWHELKQIQVELHEEMLCAGHEDGQSDACLGDSGGPLIVLEGGRWTLVGITSAGFGCGEPRQPGIYHRIPVTAHWIREVIRAAEALDQQRAVRKR